MENLSAAMQAARFSNGGGIPDRIPDFTRSVGHLYRESDPCGILHHTADQPAECVRLTLGKSMGLLVLFADLALLHLGSYSRSPEQPSRCGSCHTMAYRLSACFTRT